MSVVFVKIKGRVFGPLTEEQYKSMLDRGKLRSNDEYSIDKINWIKVDTREEPAFLEDPLQLPLKPHPSSDPKTTVQKVPGEFNPETSPPHFSTDTEPSIWYYSNNGKDGRGPYTQNAILQMFFENEINANSLLWMYEDNKVQPFSKTPPFDSYCVEKPKKKFFRRCFWWMCVFLILAGLVLGGIFCFTIFKNKSFPIVQEYIQAIGERRFEDAKTLSIGKAREYTIHADDSYDRVKEGIKAQEIPFPSIELLQIIQISQKIQSKKSMRYNFQVIFLLDNTKIMLPFNLLLKKDIDKWVVYDVEGDISIEEVLRSYETQITQ